MEWLNSHIVSITVFTPLLFSLLCLLSPQTSGSKWVALGGSVLTFLFTLHIWFWFDGTQSGLQFTESVEWIPFAGISYLVGVDGISLLLIVLTGFLTPLILVSQWASKVSGQKYFLALMLFLECGMLGALVAFDLVVFYIFWEVMLIPMYFIIGLWGGKNRIYATTKFVLYTVFGSLLMLIAAICLYLIHYEQHGFYSTSLLDLYKVTDVPVSVQSWLFGAFALAFAIKIPLWPFHTWLPHAHTEAPTAGSVILAGVLLKMGTYGFLRFAIPLFPDAIGLFAPAITSLGVIGIIYGALTAWMQTDAKKMVAYSSVSHLGFVVIGSVALLNQGLSEEALTGAVYQMINHGVSTGALFFLVGMIYERRHTRELSEFGGLAKVMPWFSVMLMIATLGSVGLPGTGGFVGEFLILLGTFKAYPAAGVLASTGVLLGAVYMLTLCKKVMFGPVVHEANRELRDLSVTEWIYITPLAILIVLMGICPEIFLSKIRPGVSHLAKNYQSYRLLIGDESQDDQVKPMMSARNPLGGK